MPHVGRHASKIHSQLKPWEVPDNLRMNENKPLPTFRQECRYRQIGSSNALDCDRAALLARNFVSTGAKIPISAQTPFV